MTVEEIEKLKQHGAYDAIATATRSYLALVKESCDRAYDLKNFEDEIKRAHESLNKAAILYSEMERIKPKGEVPNWE